MPQVHEKLPKELAPERGRVYTVVHEGTRLYTAEIVKFGGGCWATVKLLERIDVMDDPLYTPGSTFDVRVAMYEFHPVEAA